MTKHVHFAPTNIVYSPIPSTPSPALSSVSLPSSESPGPPTPPLVEGAYGSYPRTPFYGGLEPLPEIVSQLPPPMQIHFLLAYAPHAEPSLGYDLSIPPGYITEQYPPQIFSEPATNPPLPTLIISCPHLQWKIVVNPSSQATNVVTVLDVFMALYHELRLAIHPAEYQAIVGRELVDGAYFSRCGRISDSDARSAELKKGVKRVDTLKGRTQFLGLAGTVKGPNIWELYLA
ncbi:hypothetical protein BDN72DRAFT_838556 [Pluteus cervinus]|uniref:Uncharacterized protein n=1 Tax=Pluteus cervinus TaxID=181527 RepID=A0ACD3AY71_9AGAR|nr:hypothetical protein BDN72DRAFT_838556 [Pluteus cervinus]